MWKDKEKLLEKIKEVAMSKMGVILLAGVLIFLLSNLFAGGLSGQSGKSSDRDNGNAAGLWSGSDSGISGSGSSLAADTETAADETMQYIARQEERLKNILEQMDGTGKVEVMISVASSGEKVVLSDNPYSQTSIEEQDSAGGTRKTSEVSREDTTVYESDGSSQKPYVVKELEPELTGVLVLAEGAGSDTVKAEIVEAVEALFGIPAHRIKVIKRRG